MPYNKYDKISLLTSNKSQINIGDLIKIECGNANYTGILMPKYQYANSQNIIIKLQNGYNVGISIENIKNIKLIQRSKINKNIPKFVEKHNFSLPKILFLSTGGTIASNLDYNTGGISPTFDANEIKKSIPEISEFADIYTDVVFMESSENILPSHWKKIAEKIINNTDDSEYIGVIISHGTDTMHYTAAYLSFALLGFPVPIVLVGSQRSLDRPSSDAAINLISAIRFITEHKSQGVFVIMHKDENDCVVSCHIGTRVRKNHTSKRGAFKTIDSEPAFLINGDRIIKNTTKIFNCENYKARLNLDPRVALIKYYPGYSSKMMEYIIKQGYRAIIFEGTGLGHVGNVLYNTIKNANELGIFLGMTSQCINGFIQMNVYESGRKLIKLGVVPLNMIPETALVKAMWALGNSNNINEMKKLMLENIALEF